MRLDAIQGIEGPRVLDAFSANGDLWNTIKFQHDRPIKVVRIEKNKGMKGFYLQGDNLKWMRGMDLNTFNVIDLDAFGQCYDQLEELRRQRYSGVVICTWIVSLLSPTARSVMNGIGLSEDMISKAQTLCAELSPEAVMAYVYSLGVRQVRQVRQVASDKKANGFQRLYFSFKMTTL